MNPIDAARAWRRRTNRGGTAALAALWFWVLFAVFWSMIVPLATEVIASVDSFDPRTQITAINTATGLNALPQRAVCQVDARPAQSGHAILGPVFASQLHGALVGAPLIQEHWTKSRKLRSRPTRAASLYCNSIDANDEGCSSLTHPALPRRAAFACSALYPTAQQANLTLPSAPSGKGAEVAIMVLTGCASPSC
jgi:hypothetical protein